MLYRTQSKGLAHMVMDVMRCVACSNSLLSNKNANMHVVYVWATAHPCAVSWLDAWWCLDLHSILFGSSPLCIGGFASASKHWRGRLCCLVHYFVWHAWQEGTAQHALLLAAIIAGRAHHVHAADFLNTPLQYRRCRRAQQPAAG
jgi:hypothetical protein